MNKYLKTASILIIEDNDNNLLVTKRLLQVAGVSRIAGFHSSRAALAGLPYPVDLALVDLHLPGEDGYSLAQTLRQDARLASAVLVAFTANVLPPEVRQARQAGFDGFIGKPLSFEHFADQLQQLLNGQPVWQTR